MFCLVIWFVSFMLTGVLAMLKSSNQFFFTKVKFRKLAQIMLIKLTAEESNRKQDSLTCSYSLITEVMSKMLPKMMFFFPLRQHGGMCQINNKNFF